MIKQLITDLAHDSITIVQALTRAKIIAVRIKSSVLTAWLKNELGGYDSNNVEILPHYRNIGCGPYITYQFPNGSIQSKPILLGYNPSEDLKKFLFTHRVLEPVTIIEKILLDNNSEFGITMSAQEAYNISHLLKTKIDVVGGYRKIGKSTVQNIVDQTKQKLLDILLELYEEFPNLEDEFTPTPSDTQKAQSIVTTNIYGSENPVNIAAGHSVSQNNSKSNHND